MNNKRSEIWKTPHEELQLLMDESNSVVSVLKKLGFNPYNGNHRTLSQRLKEESFDMTKFNFNRKEEHKQRCKNANKSVTKSNDEIFRENSKYITNSGIKKRLLSMGVEYKCVECGIEDQYNNKKISLQLDHINGINNDNRVENLRFLCPNCHSQTITFSGKRHKKYRYCKCGKQIDKKSKNCCKCAQQILAIKWPDILYFEKILWEKPIVEIAKELGVSDASVVSHVKKLGINKPKHGYWLKKSV